MTPRLLLALLASLILMPALAQPASAQQNTTVAVTGRLQHGGDNREFDPTRVPVTLNVLEGVSSFAQQTVAPQPDGTFEFTVATANTRTYFFSVEYQGASYQQSRFSDGLGEPVIIEVYEATNDPSVLDFNSYTVIVTGAVADEGWIEVLERASISNESGMTLVPNQEVSGPAMLNFLRFALPTGAYNLDVRSNLTGGDVLEVDRGFAVTTSILPTEGDPHLFEFVYRLDYEGTELDLSRTMRFGADSFRYVAPADVGRPASERLTDLGATELDGRFLRLLEGGGVEPGEVIPLRITELPQPSFWANLGERSGEWYVRFVVPTLIAGGLLSVTGWAVMRRRLAAVPATADAPTAYDQLLAQAADLEGRWQEGTVSKRRYETERAAIKQALVDLRVQMHTSAR